jgi:glycosyltransferase involved in cell wall biosynthesis
MLVSVITVYYNREKHVEESIKSLLNQSYSDLEIIAVDDGSTDSTYDLLCSFSDERLKVIKNENQGFVKSLKDAIEIAKGEYIAIHGSGDISLGDRIEKQAALLNSDKAIGLVGCYVEDINVVRNQKKVRKPSIDPSMDLTKQFIESNKFTHGEVMYRRDVYQKAGGYREYFKFAQDRDLWLRMSLITKFAVVEEVLYRRYQLVDGVNTNTDKFVVQRYLASMACQCIKMRVKSDRDLIEKYGHHAGFFKERDPRLGKELLIEAVSKLLKGDMEAAKLLIKLSIKEGRTLHNLSFKLIISFCAGNDYFARYLIKALNKVKKLRKA